MPVRMDDHQRSPGFLQTFAPVGFAMGFVLCCFALPVFGALALLWLLGG